MTYPDTQMSTDNNTPAKPLAQPKKIIIFRSEDDKSASALLLAGKKPIEITTSAEENRWLLQDILVGRVSRIVPALASAFVDIGEKEEGLLPLKKAPSTLKTGQTVIVQISRVTASNKGSQLTALPQIPGFFAVYRPFGPRNLKRSRLQQFEKTKATELFRQEVERLEKVWLQINADVSADGQAPRLLARFNEPIFVALRDWLEESIDRILVEDTSLFTMTDEYLAKYVPFWQHKLSLAIENSSFSLPDLVSLPDLKAQLSSKKIYLSNGGSLVFEQTEALLAIDVNSGKSISDTNAQKNFLQTNMLAAKEIARLLRLRKIQGLVVIDYINLKSMSDQKQLENYFRQLLSLDKAMIKIGGFTVLGLFELTRSLKH